MSSAPLNKDKVKFPAISYAQNARPSGLLLLVNLNLHGTWRKPQKDEKFCC